MNNNREYIFYINWEDTEKNPYRVGFLAQLESEYYFIISDQKNAEAAYERGFIGIPGFNAGEIYKSSELFDFFKSRVLDKKSENPCEELSQTKGVSMVDSFSLEEVSDKMLNKYKVSILETYEMQEKLNTIKEYEETHSL